MPQAEQIASLPIDLQAEFDRLQALPESIRSFPPSGSHTAYQVAYPGRLFTEVASSYLEDRRKVDLRHGLGRLGLLAIDHEKLPSMKEQDATYYAIALTDYSYLLEHRARILPSEGTISGPRFEALYGSDVDDKWAAQYAQELTKFNEMLLRTGLYQDAEALREQVPQTGSTNWRRLLHKRDSGVTQRWELHRKPQLEGTSSMHRFTMHLPMPKSRARKAA